MRFEQALDLLKQGLPIYRSSWPKGSHVRKDNLGGIFYITRSHTMNFYTLNFQDIQATDWEEYTSKEELDLTFGK